MDPLSALSAASAIVQFVDFTGKLFYGTYKIYKATTNNDDDNSLKAITKGFIVLTDDIRKTHEQAILNHQLSPREEEFSILCKNCINLANELVVALEKLQVEGKYMLWDSFRQALRTIWHQRELASLQTRLNLYRQQISMHILASLQ
jgi:hypothetical protein